MLFLSLATAGLQVIGRQNNIPRSIPECQHKKEELTAGKSRFLRIPEDCGPIQDTVYTTPTGHSTTVLSYVTLDNKTSHIGQFF